VDLTRRDVVRLLDEVEERGAVARNRCLTAISALLAFAVDRGVIEAHPALGIRRLPETSRARVLEDGELLYLWRRLDELQLARSTVMALKLMACTGCRPGEATGARWDEMNGAVWTVPAARTKNGRPHEVPLSPMARQVIAEARQLGSDVFLFPSPRMPGKPIGRLALSQALNRAQTSRKQAVIELPDTNPHDLRRTVATGLKRLGVAPHVVEEVLGHVSTHRGGLVGVYDRHDYAVEKRQALERWSNHLAGLIYGDGVEVLRR
jgi:integrase